MTTDHIKMLQATVDKSRATIHDNGTVSIGKPRHKEWQQISQYEIKDISDALGFHNKDHLYEFAHAIEAKLKEKNT